MRKNREKEISIEKKSRKAKLCICFEISARRDGLRKTGFWRCRRGPNTRGVGNGEQADSFERLLFLRFYPVCMNAETFWTCLSFQKQKRTKTQKSSILNRSWLTSAHQICVNVVVERTGRRARKACVCSSSISHSPLGNSRRPTLIESARNRWKYV